MSGARLAPNAFLNTIHTYLQKKGMAKLMDLDYVIQYRKGKENIAADALSRCMEEGMVALITVVTPNWC